MIIIQIEILKYLFCYLGALFTTEYVDHKIGLPGISISSAAAAIQAQGGLFSINHLDIYYEGKDLRNICVGCRSVLPFELSTFSLLFFFSTQVLFFLFLFFAAYVSAA